MSAWGIDEDVPELASPVDQQVDVDEFMGKLDKTQTGASQEVQKLLIECCQNGNSMVVKELLAHPEAKSLVDINSVDDAGSTALTYGSCFGHELVVAELLRFGANTDIQDRSEWTALMWAANNNNLPIVKQLISAGADKSLKTSSGTSAMDLAAPTSSVGLYLRDQDDGGAGEFYKEAVDPIEMEARFNHELKESADALGGFDTVGVSTAAAVDVADADDDEDVILAAPVKQKLHAREFEWDHFKIRDSFALPKEQIPRFLDIVITEIQPTLQKQQAPTSANALFLAIRYMFYCGNTDSFTALTAPICRRVTMVIEEHQRDLAYLTYWLSNAEILRYLLQKDRAGLSDATKDDLQLMLQQLVEQISQKIQEQAQHLLTPLITACVLNYDSVPEYGKVQYRDEWRIFKNSKSSSSGHGTGNAKKNTDLNELAKQHMLPPSYEMLMKNPGPQRVTSVLSSLLFLFQIYGVHPISQAQIIAQLLYFMSSRMFNTIINERKYLNRRRAIQIRLNVSVVEDWCRNHNFRPESGELSNGKNYNYKSLIEIGRTFLAPLVQLLAWLQTFSGFGDDFTNVVSTLQELKALNPKQLLQSATHYRFETREAPLSKEYRAYLKELARHHEKKTPLSDYTRTEAKGNADDNYGKNEDIGRINASKGTSSPTRMGQDHKADIIDLMSDPIPEQVGSDVLAHNSSSESPAISSVPLPSSPPTTFIISNYELPVSDEILLSDVLEINEHVPLFNEADEFWGREMLDGLTESVGGRFIVPYIGEDAAPKLATMLNNGDDNATSEEESNTDVHEHERIEEPEMATRPPADDTAELDMGIAAWSIDDDNAANVW